MIISVEPLPSQIRHLSQRLLMLEYVAFHNHILQFVFCTTTVVAKHDFCISLILT